MAQFIQPLQLQKHVTYNFAVDAVPTPADVTSDVVAKLTVACSELTNLKSKPWSDSLAISPLLVAMLHDYFAGKRDGTVTNEELAECEVRKHKAVKSLGTAACKVHSRLFTFTCTRACFSEAKQSLLTLHHPVIMLWLFSSSED